MMQDLDKYGLTFKQILMLLVDTPNSPLHIKALPARYRAEVVHWLLNDASASGRFVSLLLDGS